MHVLLDMKGAPKFAYFLAAVYLSDIHTLIWNKEKKCIPTTAIVGQPHDISILLQFVFWERILYLNNVGNFTASKERPSYFLDAAQTLVAL